MSDNSRTPRFFTSGSDFVKKVLNQNNVNYIEDNHGTFHVGNAFIDSDTSIWYHPQYRKKGKGALQFVTYLSMDESLKALVRKMDIVLFAKNLFDHEMLTYKEISDGQFRIDDVDFSVDTDEWHDTKNGTKGRGLYTYVQHLLNDSIPPERNTWKHIENLAQKEHDVDDHYKITMLNVVNPMSSGYAKYQLTHIMSGHRIDGEIYQWGRKN
jgi:hypothetical protein